MIKILEIEGDITPEGKSHPLERTLRFYEEKLDYKDY